MSNPISNVRVDLAGVLLPFVRRRFVIVLFWVAFHPPSTPGLQPPTRPEKTDAYGHPLPNGAVARIGNSGLRHPGDVHEVAFNSDGTRLAVTSTDGSVTAWETATGRLIGREWSAGLRAAVAFREDGKSVATFAAPGGLLVYDPDSRKSKPAGACGFRLRIDEVEDHSSSGNSCLALSPDSKWLAYRHSQGDRGRIVVVDPVAGEKRLDSALKHFWKTQLTFSQDGARLAVVDGETARSDVIVVDSKTGKRIWETTIDGMIVSGVTLDRMGEFVGVVLRPNGGTNSPRVRIWNVEKDKTVMDYSAANKHDHISADLSPDGRTLAVLEDRNISLVDVPTGKVGRTFDARWEYGRVRYSPDGRTMAVFSANRVQLLDTTTGRWQPDPYDWIEPDNVWVRPDGLYFRADGKLLSRSYPNPRVLVWDPVTGNRVDAIDPPPGGRFINDVSPDGKRLVYAHGPLNGPNDYRIWDRSAGKDVAISKVPPRGEFLYTPDGKRLFLRPYDSDIWELNPETLNRIGQFTLKAGPFSTSQAYPSTLSADRLRRFELPTDRPHWFPNGTLRNWDVTTGTEGAAIRWAPASELNKESQYVGDFRFLNNYAVSADGGRVAVLQFVGRRGPQRFDDKDRTRGKLVLSEFETADGRERARFDVSTELDLTASENGRVVLSPDGRLAVILGIDGNCHVVELSSGTGRMTIGTNIGGNVTSARRISIAVFSPDGRLLVTYDRFHSVLVWDLYAPLAEGVPGELPAAWEALTDRSAEKAFRAIVRLIGGRDDAVKFLTGKVRSTPTPTDDQVATWVARLDAACFADREEAERSLLSAVAYSTSRHVAALGRSARETPSAEVRTRIKRVLKNIDVFNPAPEDLRAARAIEVLERIGTRDALILLKQLSSGPDDDWLTRWSKESLGRIDRAWK